MHSKKKKMSVSSTTKRTASTRTDSSRKLNARSIIFLSATTFLRCRRAIAPRKTAVAFRAPSGYKEVTAGLGLRRGDGRRCSRWVDKEVPAGLGRRRGDGRRCSRWWIPEENVCENFLRLLCMFARAGSPNYTRWSVQGGLHQANGSLDFSSAVRVV